MPATVVLCRLCDVRPGIVLRRDGRFCMRCLAYMAPTAVQVAPELGREVAA